MKSVRIKSWFETSAIDKTDELTNWTTNWQSVLAFKVIISFFLHFAKKANSQRGSLLSLFYQLPKRQGSHKSLRQLLHVKNLKLLLPILLQCVDSGFANIVRLLRFFRHHFTMITQWRKKFAQKTIFFCSVETRGFRRRNDSPFIIHPVHRSFSKWMFIFQKLGQITFTIEVPDHRPGFFKHNSSSTLQWNEL